MADYVFSPYTPPSSVENQSSTVYNDINNNNEATGTTTTRVGISGIPTTNPFTINLSDANNPIFTEITANYNSDVQGLNDNGQVIINYNEIVNPDGTTTSLTLPGISAEATDLDNTGRVYGTYVDSNNVQHGFELNNGAVTTIDPPGSVATYLGHANNNGQVAGYYTDSSGNDHGFYYTLGGDYTEIDYPGYSNTKIFGINDFGEVVGVAYNSVDAGSNPVNGVAFVYSNSNFNVIDNVADGSSDNFVPSSINDYGQIVGNESSYNPVSVYENLNPVYRFYDTVTNDHFYTTSAAEKASIQANLPTFTYEGAPWATPDAGSNTEDVFRFYDTVTKTHFLTDSVAEKTSIQQNQPTFTYEGVAFEAYTTVENASEFALERFYNTNTHVHTYSADPAETAAITSGQVGQGWVDEGASFIVHKALAS